MPPGCRRCWSPEIDHRFERGIGTWQQPPRQLSFIIGEFPIEFGDEGFNVPERVIYDRNRKVDIICHPVDSSGDR